VIKVYVASGWFSPRQQDTLNTIASILDCRKEFFYIFYPRDESASLQVGLQDPRVRTQIFRNNIQGIRRADLVICSTEDKDPGSLWEAGYAYGWGKPIIYVNFNVGKSFNLMLAESAVYVATSPNELIKALQILTDDPVLGLYELKRLKRVGKVE
jgi:nucleoside 2-deoxyribosyltransferase